MSETEIMEAPPTPIHLGSDAILPQMAEDEPLPQVQIKNPEPEDV